MANIVLDRLSVSSISPGQTFTLYGSNMANTNYVQFEKGSTTTPVEVSGAGGSATQQSVTVPTDLATGSYEVFMTTGMGGGDASGKKALAVQASKP